MDSKLLNYNEEGVLINKYGEDILVKWSNIENFSTSALVRIKLFKNLALGFIFLGFLLSVMFIISELNQIDSEKRFQTVPMVVGFFMYLVMPIVGAVTFWKVGVKPHKEYFDNDYHVITLMLNDSPTKEIVYVGSLNETIEAFNELKQLYQKSKLKQ